MARLRLEGVTVTADGGRRLLEDVTLVVADGERAVVLGATGSGKTTLLRTVAGVTEVAAGALWLDDRDVTHHPPRDRDVAMVSQQGALQPHLDVRSNLGFALRLRGVTRREVATRVDAEADAFSLHHLMRRRPRTLAAGERHEVALARSLVRRCSVLLLDEPFARIDPDRRDALRHELIRVQQGYAVTTLLATNDPLTALGFAETVVILDDRRVVQTGPTAHVTARPATRQVAELLILPTPSIVRAHREGHGARRRLVAGPLTIAAPHLPGVLPTQVDVAVRPSDVQLTPGGSAVVRHRAFLGHQVEVTVVRGGTTLRAHVARPGPALGDRVQATVAAGAALLFDPTTGRALLHDA